MQIQDAADLAIEVHFASLDAASEKCAWRYLENFTGHSKTIGMNQTSNTDAVADLHFLHYYRLRKITEDNQKLCGEDSTKGKIFRRKIY